MTLFERQAARATEKFRHAKLKRRRQADTRRMMDYLWLIAETIAPFLLAAVVIWLIEQRTWPTSRRRD